MLKILLVRLTINQYLILNLTLKHLSDLIFITTEHKKQCSQQSENMEAKAGY